MGRGILSKWQAFRSPPLTAKPCDPAVLCGISSPLGLLSPSPRQISHALLTRAPLYSRSCPLFRVRLACLIHAASVRSEPGSNSHMRKLETAQALERSSAVRLAT